MGIFQQFPYSNFHEMNLDEIIKIVKNMVEEWAQYYDTWDDWKEQVTQEWADMQDFINDYFDDLDVQTEINNKLTSMVNSGEFSEIVSPYVPPAVTAWLADHITTPETVVIDDSLTIAGAVADAKATGDAINEVKTYLSERTENLWTAGSKIEFVTEKTIPISLSAGDYTVNAIITSSDTSQDRSAIIFNYEDNTSETVLLYRNTRRGANVTLTGNVTSVKLRASTNYSASNGKTATWSEIGLFTKKLTLTYYVPPITAVDIPARTDLISLGDEFFDATVQTKNVWAVVDNAVVEGFKDFKGAIAAGTYTLSAICETTSTTNQTCGVYFYDDNSDLITNVAIPANVGERKYVSVTLGSDASQIRLYASGNSSASTGQTGTYKEIMLTESDYHYDYVPTREAADYTLRSSLLANKGQNFVMSAYVRDGSSQYGNQGAYRFFVSNDGKNFNMLDYAFPSEIKADDASAIIYFNGFFIFGCHYVEDGSQYMQFLATKDFAVWEESKLLIPAPLSTVRNTAISFYEDAGELYVAWSAQYQADSGNIWYQAPYYINVNVDSVGAVTFADVAASTIAIGDTANNDSYLDPYVLKIEGAYLVAIKNEITSNIELWKGAALNSMTKLATYINAKGCEAPSIVFNPTTRIVTVYASGYNFGGELRNLLLYDSFRVTGTFTSMSYFEHRFSLAEYYSLFTTRHPYVIAMPNIIKTMLAKLKTAVQTPWPAHKTLNFKMRSDGKIVQSSDSTTELKSFITHPRITYHITSNVNVEPTGEYDLNLIVGQDLNITFEVEPGCKAGFLFSSNGWNNLANHKIVMDSTNSIPVNTVFHQINKESNTVVISIDKAINSNVVSV